MKGPLQDLLKQAQKMQADLQQAQEKLADLKVTGQAGGGMVSISMTGRYQVERVQIDPGLCSEDREMLEDLIAAAFNDALTKVQAATQERFAGLATQLPPGLKLPF